MDCPAVETCVKGMCREGARCTGCDPGPGALAVQCSLAEACAITLCDTGRIDLDRNPYNGCEAGCRPSGSEVCDGVDNDCNGLRDDVATGNCSCEPGTIRCLEGVTLLKCDTQGGILSRRSCGAVGCNEIRGRCNDCVPNTLRCEGEELVSCGADGAVTGREQCKTDWSCQGVGYCNQAKDACDVREEVDDGTPCDEGTIADGTLCNSSCIAGVCTTTSPECSDGDVCTTDQCSETVGCSNSALDCADTSACTTDWCDPAFGCRNDAIECDDDDVCTIDRCEPNKGCAASLFDCSFTATDCRSASSCDSQGNTGNCGIVGADINEGFSCGDCTSGSCDVCEAGHCLDLHFCDGTNLSPSCSSDAECVGLPECSDTECLEAACSGSIIEQQACSDGTNVHTKCESSSCTGDKTSHVDSIGFDCADSSIANVTMEYVFWTDSPSGTPFLIWMRNIVDTSWDTGEHYTCDLNGVTGVGTLNMTLTEMNIVAGRHGSGCSPTTTPSWCWLALDGDPQTATSAPIPLLAGAHTLSCSISTSAPAEEVGFDGIIYTADLDYIPDAFDGRMCTDDADFEYGTCDSVNWGPNRAAASGYCKMDPVDNGTSCAGGICQGGVCQ